MFKAKICQCAGLLSITPAGPGIDFESCTYQDSISQLTIAGADMQEVVGAGGGGGANLKCYPQLLLCVRRIVGAFGSRQEQRGGNVGEGHWRLGGKDDAFLPACLVGFYTNVNVHQ